MKNLSQLIATESLGTIRADRFVRIQYPESSVLFYDPADDNQDDPSPYSNTTVLSLGYGEEDFTLQGDQRETIWEVFALKLMNRLLVGGV